MCVCVFLCLLSECSAYSLKCNSHCDRLPRYANLPPPISKSHLTFTRSTLTDRGRDGRGVLCVYATVFCCCSCWFSYVASYLNCATKSDWCIFLTQPSTRIHFEAIFINFTSFRFTHIYTYIHTCAGEIIVVIKFQGLLLSNSLAIFICSNKHQQTNSYVLNVK